MQPGTSRVYSILWAKLWHYRSSQSKLWKHSSYFQLFLTVLIAIQAAPFTLLWNIFTFTLLWNIYVTMKYIYSIYVTMKYVWTMVNTVYILEAVEIKGATPWNILHTPWILTWFVYSPVVIRITTGEYTNHVSITTGWIYKSRDHSEITKHDKTDCLTCE